uniref:Uncharacterized protein n=1 Tax=Rhizophora mucronata TaxID=61149 RepID=A0A2P2P580_RHIMU
MISFILSAVFFSFKISSEYSII